jgi:hypothetical protein
MRNGVCGETGVSAASEAFPDLCCSNSLTVGDRSPVDIERRLDKLIEEIKGAQKPFMRGGGPGDVVLVS